LRHLVDRAVKPTAHSIQRVIQSCVCKIKDLLPGDIDLYDEFIVSEMLYKKAVIPVSMTLRDLESL